MERKQIFKTGRLTVFYSRRVAEVLDSRELDSVKINLASGNGYPKATIVMNNGACKTLRLSAEGVDILVDYNIVDNSLPYYPTKKGDFRKN